MDIFKYSKKSKILKIYASHIGMHTFKLKYISNTHTPHRAPRYNIISKTRNVHLHVHLSELGRENTRYATTC